ncbi:TonB-dependent receptor family protein [Pseudomonas sp. PDM13]|uniref:TonB-dependent receptor family protein n=1 Tax=Pseudomonas sp. PDM13 TaxID=2769255 RepID=UPI0021E06E06|nr:TonB-dependent receptor [Pseudomonas sp. PDM13]MCU9948417.1 TonB-dependent receptor [Pseudomonas sp. PDM13]
MPTYRSAWALSLALTPLAQAETLQVEPLVITGSRYPASGFELPFSVDRIEREQASSGQPGVNLSEALNAVPGLVVQNRQNQAQDLQVSSRGFGARSAFGIRGIKLIADGIPASNPDGQGQAATFDLDTLDHIEVLRGPFASIYGSNAGGVIQVFSRDGQGAPKVSSETSQGAWGTSRTRITAEGGNDKGGFLVNQSHYESDGYRKHSAATLDKSFAKLTLYPDDDSKLALTFSQLNQNGTQDPLGLTWAGYQADPRGVADAALNYDTRKTIDHRQAGLNYERAFAAGTWQATLYGGTRRVIQYQAIPASAQASPRSAGGVIDFERSFQGASTRWLQDFDPGLGNLTLTTGVDYDQSSDVRQGYENFVGSQLGVRGNLRRDERDEVSSIAPYLQLGWRLGDFNLQGGLRYNEVAFDVDDHYIRPGNGDDSGSVTYRDLTPTLGASYALTPELNLYASWGKGFETPTLNELSYSGPGDSFGFDLGAATSRQYEVGLKSLIGEATRLNLALFRIDTEDELVVDAASGGRTRYQNAARTRRQGLELSVDSALSETLHTRLAYTRLSATYDQGFTSGGRNIPAGRHLPGVPATSLWGELEWRPRAGISTALEGLYRSKLYVEDSNSARPAPGYALLNWRARFEQKLERLTFSQTLRLDNLLDRRYIGSVIVGDGNQRYYEPGPGRAWYVAAGVEYAFD